MVYKRPTTKPYPSLRKSINRRRWLNPKKGSGHITWSVEVPSFHKGHKKGDHGQIDTPEVNLSIADCTRSITLDFWGGTRKDSQATALRKVDLLISELQDFRIAIERAYERQKELLAANPKARVW